jgi:large subunit ribosomal protein L13
MRTFLVKKEDAEKNRRWCHVDAKGKVLGRLATSVATALMGKDRPDYTPHVDTGAYVVVTNAELVRVTGKKRSEKVYQRYSGYPGGRKEIPFEEMMQKKPEQVIREAVRRMLPKNKLGKQMIKKLRVYRGAEHPHAAHKPEELEV